MRLRTLLMALAGAILTLPTTPATAVETDSPLLPVTNGQYVGQAASAFDFGVVGGFVLGNGVLRDFVVTDQTVNGSNSRMTADVRFYGLGSGDANGFHFAGGVALGGWIEMETMGNQPNPVGGPFVMQVADFFLEGSGPAGSFVQARESQVIGEDAIGEVTVSDLGGGQYAVDSFFDVFIEISVDALGPGFENPIGGSVRFDLGELTGTPRNPIIPDPNGSGGWVFTGVFGSGWFDPPMATGYLYETDNSAFTIVSLPTPADVPGDGFYTVTSVHGSDVVAAGDDYVFFTPVSKFTVTGIDPPVDGSDPQAFPTFLVTADPVGANIMMTPIPEPSTMLLMVFGLAMSGIGHRKTQPTN